jgi:hypothetical protein
MFLDQFRLDGKVALITGAAALAEAGTDIISILRKHDVLTKIAERVRFARRRFGRYEVIDFLAVLLAGLEPERASTRLSPTGAAPTRRSEYALT